MAKQPTWRTGVVVYLIYNAIIFGTWAAVGADYTNMVAVDVILERLVLPLTLGALFMLAALTWLGWWRPVMSETRRGRPGWTLWAMIAVMAGFILANVGTTNWSAIGGVHWLLLIAAGVLVGFNEEALTRGVLVVGWRGATANEVWVWFWSSLLFGLLHLPNGFFGAGFVASPIQVLFAFLAGSGFYLLRRVSGTLLIPMALHGAWDFATFSHQASGASPSPMITAFQFGTYLVSIGLVILVLRVEQRSSR